MDTIRADQLDFDPRTQMSRIFVEGFYPWIKSICEDKDTLTAVFAHMFDVSRFFVAVDGGRVAAMASCTSGVPPVALDRKTFSRVLGLVRGNISFMILKRHMMSNALPFDLSPKTGVIEFVATSPDFQRRGAAYSLLEYVMESQPFDSYVLEVADNNDAAIRLYEKLGFKEIRRVKGSKRSGVNEFVYMRTSRQD